MACKVRQDVKVKGVSIPGDIIKNKKLTLNRKEALMVNGVPLVHATFIEGKKTVHVYHKLMPGHIRARQAHDRELEMVAKKIARLLKNGKK